MIIFILSSWVVVALDIEDIEKVCQKKGLIVMIMLLKREAFFRILSMMFMKRHWSIFPRQNLLLVASPNKSIL